MYVLLLLIFGHALGDYSFQSEYMALSKNRNHAMGANGVWLHCLTMHAVIHGGIVGIITHSASLGIAEFLAHFAIDFFKCEKKYGYHTDQIIHIACKFLWWIIWSHWSLP
jgi:hypothetical protein